MKLDTTRRWILLGGLLAATLAAAAWVGERSSPEPELVGASEPGARAPSSPARADRPGNPEQLNLEKLQSRDLASPSTDPFAVRKPRAEKPRPPAARIVQPAIAPAAPPSAPSVPFTYLGKLVEGDEVAVFLSQGDRNLVVREGETIDSTYRVERIAESAITLTYLPLNQRQTIVTGGAQ